MRAAGEEKSGKMSSTTASPGDGIAAECGTWVPGGGSAGQRQTSDLEGGAGTPPQLSPARPVTWRGVPRHLGGVFQNDVDIILYS